MPARVLLQDFTGVPAVVDLAAMRDAMARAGRRPAADQPAAAGRAGDRPLGAGRRVRHARPPSCSTPSSSSSATASATPSCAGARQAFDNFRVVPPDTGIVHQVNLEYLARVVLTRARRRRTARLLGLSRHAGRHRLAHDDDQRPRRARLGRRRHRGRGGDARPAGVDADPAGGRLPAHRQAARGRDRHRPRADRHRDAAQAAAWSGKFVEFFGPGLASLPLADRATIANMAPEYGATCGIFPVDQDDARLPALHRPAARSRSRSSRRT